MDKQPFRNPRNPQIGERVLTARRRKDLTQAELAQQAGMSPVTISRLEGGEQSVSAERLAVIAKILEVSLDYLCRKDDTIHTTTDTQRNEIE